MPFILSLLAIAAGGYFWLNRARNAAFIASDLADMAQDVMGAARRFGFRRQANVHPVDSLEDAGVAVAAIGIGFLELGGLPRAEQHEALLRSLQVHQGMSHAQAQEAVILGRWLTVECGGPGPGVDRLCRRLWKLQGAAGFTPMMAVLKAVSDSGSIATSVKQKDALDAVARAFRVT
ncbi:MAG: hypothetical protein ABI832_07045 [bacterium]